MLILGIETSCDETAVAVVQDGIKVHSSLIRSQIETHASYGGIIPELAAREHLNALDYLLEQCLQQTKINLKDISAIAVTQGPGLVGSLVVGASYAKGLACGLNLPLIRVDHVKAHIFSAFLNDNLTLKPEDIFPALALVASGGHTNLYYMHDMLTIKLIGYTLDDACGECFDKVAKMLNLKYPGGVYIEKHAQKGNPQAFPMPKVTQKQNNLMFSYSGLKTHMWNLITNISKDKISQNLADICASFQHEALSQIIRKLKIATKKYKTTKSIIIGGGVSANQYLRYLLQQNFNLSIFCPPTQYCSDNAAMIASYGYFIFKNTPDNSHSCFDAWDVYSRYNFSSN